MSTDEFHEQVRADLAHLDGSIASAVSLLTGLSRDELDQLGGFDAPTDSHDPR